METIHRTYTIEVRRWRKATDAERSSGSAPSIHLPNTIERVSIEVDIEHLARTLGDRACRSSRGRATGLSGHVVVKRVKEAKS